MGSFFDRPGVWRLRSNGGVVPFKFLGLEGSFEPESGSVTLRGLIPSEQLVNFVIETFPPPQIVGNMAIPQGSKLPGLPGLIATKVSFVNQDPSRPIDPFGFDPGAPSGTYHPVMEVKVEYGMNRLQKPDPADPRTFLEISSHATGEVLHTTTPQAKWQTKTPDPKDDDKKDPGAGGGNPRLPDKDKAKETVKDPTVPVNIIVPTTEWTVKWNQIPYSYFNQILIYRLRWCMGRVNENFFPLLHNADPETILFDGYNYTESYTWRDGEVGTPPINLEMKFIEKRVVWNGMVCGHNHFWRPNSGWTYLLINGKTIAETEAANKAAMTAWIAGGKVGSPPVPLSGGPIYALRDHNVLFNV